MFPLTGAPMTTSLTATSTGAAAIFLNLAPGDYSLDFTLPASVAAIGTTPPLPTTVIVGPQIVTNADVLITSVTR